MNLVGYKLMWGRGVEVNGLQKVLVKTPYYI